MAIAKLMPEIAMLDRLRVGLPHVVNAHESAQHRKMAGSRIMQPCKKPVYNMHTSTWMNVEARASGTRRTMLPFQAVSRARTTVVPTATTLPPRARVALTAFGVAAGAWNVSGLSG